MQTLFAHEAFLRVSVLTDSGWTDQGLAWEAGPEIVKRQVIPLDLTGVSGDTVRVRLHAPASFWLIDFVGLDASVESPSSVRSIRARRVVHGAPADVLETLSAADGRELRLATGDSMELQFDVPAESAGHVRSYLLRSTGWYRIHTAGDGEPDLALLAASVKPGGIAAASAARLNVALERLRMTDGVR
jgi:hypothetical protein